MEHATIKLNELGRAKIHDEQGNEYYITGINVSAQEDLDITVEAIETVEKVVTNQFAQTIPKPDVDRLFKYIFSALMDYDLINHQTPIGRARNLVGVIVAGAAEDILVPTNNADPDAQCEATTK